MEIDFSKLNIVRKYDPEIVNLKLFSKYPSLYTFIRFWGRLPDYLLDDLIDQFKGGSKKVLFDPFGGSGSAIFKALNNDFSKIIYNDLNPTFAFITKALYNGLLIPRCELEESIDKLKQSLISSPVILDLLKIDEAPLYIHKIAYTQLIILRREQDKVDIGFKQEVLNDTAEEIIRVLTREKVMTFSMLREKVFHCLKDYDKLESRSLFSVVLNKLVRKKLVKKEIKKDYLILSPSVTFPKDVKVLERDQNTRKILERKEKKYQHLIKHDVFSFALKYNNGVPFRKAEGARTIGELYSTWSKILLSTIWEGINQFKVQNEDIINIFKLCFLASLYDSSNMQMPHKSGWIIKSFWIPPTHGTKNPLYVFVKKLNQFLSVYASLKTGWNGRTKVLIYNKDIFEFTKREFRYKPDVIITHPPYFSTVQYGELSAIWASWLGCQIPFEKEIVQNVRQGKSRDVYLSLLKRSLEKISSLSCKNADVTLIFQSKDQQDWKFLDKVLLQVPLELKQIRCYQRSSWWGSKQIFNIGDFDYALLFRNQGG